MVHQLHDNPVPSCGFPRNRGIGKSLHRKSVPMENNSQYPDRGELSEDERLAKELSDLKLMFPQKKFRIAEVDGIRKVEVVLDWW